VRKKIGMTKNPALKAAARAHSQATGQPYVASRRA
jgi:hypothetical protein